MQRQRPVPTATGRMRHAVHDHARPDGAGRRRRGRAAMTRLRTALKRGGVDCRRGDAGVVLALHVVGSGVLLAFVVPAHLHLGTTVAPSAPGWA